MNWNDKNTQPGQLVASQTTGGDYKDLDIVTCKEGGSWALVSLQDGFQTQFESKADLIERLNKYRHVPIVKMIGSGRLPENRAELPMVQITGLRGFP